MNQHLQSILDFIQQDQSLSADEKHALSKSLKEADKELEITAFKLDRTEKVKRTTATLLEETIEELEQKRKAIEAQNRELEVEASLERVRARTMAMKQTGELAEAATVLYKELLRIGIPHLTCSYEFVETDEKFLDSWIAKPDGSIVPNAARIPLNEDSLLIRRKESWMKKEPLLIEVAAGNDRKEHLDYMSQFAPKAVVEDLWPLIPEPMLVYTANFSQGFIMLLAKQQLSNIEELILTRFAKVFDQTYVRFLDLQKAEAQAREAQIELALERVRARTMAMQHSEELQEAANLLFQQVQALGIPAWSCGYNIWEKEEKVCTGWMSSQGILQPSFSIPLTESPSFVRQYNSRLTGEEFYAEKVEGQALVDHYQYMATLPEFQPILANFLKAGFTLPASQINHVVNFSNGNVIFITSEPVAEAHDIFKRFAKVFEQTYTRFLDLQKAEAQAREAKIQLAMERVRARTMAMQKSDELAEAAQLLYQQFRLLGIERLTSAYMFVHEETSTQDGWAVLADGSLIPELLTFPLTGDSILDARYQSWKKMRPIHHAMLDKAENKRHHRFLAGRLAPNISPKIFNQYLNLNELHFYNANFSKGYLLVITTQIFSEEEENILARFAKVFEQTYTRFLDLQKAEAQAREAQIEAAMEKIRGRSLAMNHSDELKDVAMILFKKLDELKVAHNTVAIQLFDFETKDSIFWPGNLLQDEPPKVRLPYDEKMMKEDTCHKDLWKAMSKGDMIFNKVYTKDQKDRWFEYVFANNDTNVILPHAREFILSAEVHTVCFIPQKNSALFSDSWDGSLFTEEEFNVLRRAAKVFEQAYIRFLDLQKAEAQAREATIEAALEKIRSKSLSMHHSAELKDVIATMFEKLNELNVLLGTVAIWLFNKATMDSVFWVGNNWQQPSMVNLPYDEQLMKEGTNYRDSWQAFLSSENYINKEYSVEQKNKYFRYVFAHNDLVAIPPAARERLMQEQKYTACLLVEKNSALYFDSWQESVYDEESISVLKRVIKVFEQSYIRFLDLQKAEGQAREAKIEAALEKVRSRSLAMHKSVELEQVVTVVLNKLLELGFVIDDGAAVHLEIFVEGTKDFVQWSADPLRKETIRSKVPFTNLPPLTDFFDAKEKGLDFFTKVYSFEEKNEWFNYAFEYSDFKYLPDDLKQVLLQSESYEHWIAIEKNSALVVNSVSGSRLSNVQIEILKRFAKVFEQAYVRFLDLQKAEAQAKEAQIELGLERVRARAMAMRNSDELSGLVGVLFEELVKLNLILYRCIIWIFNPDTLAARMWMANSEDRENAESYFIKKLDHPYYDAILKGWKEKKPKWVYELQGKDKRSIDKLLFTETELANLPESVKAGILSSKHTIVSGSFNNFGLIEASGPVQQSEEQLEILSRFGKVFDLTYTRFNDLKQAEAQAREAQIQLALERVRARTMAMQKSDELADVATLLFQQVKELGITAWTTGFNVWSDDNNYYTDYVTNPQGGFIEPYTIDATQFPVFVGVSDAKKRSDEFYVQHVEGELLKETYRQLSKFGEKQYKALLDTGFQFPVRQFHHFVFGSKVSLMFITYEPVPEAYDIFKRFGKVFEQTYTRFLDLKKAEAHAVQAQLNLAQIQNEKKRAEEALAELQQTQQQLIQSEKMASLGELTAGIAHEIQNPLNFVNNFSEVSAEMMDEMKKEFVAGNKEEGVALISDIKQNLEKILHHGQRADAIVKSMLQHSRSSTGKKEPTNINALAYEYLRLAYQGLRAKDKSFNATIKKDFDKSIGKINVIPQDIGRVILNLITNAFYAVTEKKEQQPEGFEPTVSVCTQKMEDKILISVKDNGNGIPQKLLDKIFLPFFTTKPTGQGTGLGLSLAYDIVKAHGGELKVETKEGEGAEFIMTMND